jgi:hypothetical protein
VPGRFLISSGDRRTRRLGDERMEQVG